AQCGSFVPAESANLPIVDRIFTRIGASDHLSRGESTVMVEMTETAQILSQATATSLILMDEIGRGTSTYDGLSLAWAIIEFLSEMSSVKPKTLFATHYHELTQLERIPGVKNYHLHVKEDGAALVFLNKIVEGPADDSYGIQVAELAGLPRILTDRAKGILRELESSGHDHPKTGGLENAKSAPSNILSSPAMDLIQNELSTLDLNHLTPFEALSLIADWKKSTASKA
ncbi:MAG: DNA mismatch repair protein MutS, partial [Spirochaetia bacterium]|nr:DNA mismatch repair protein MutS [Spirochaetia bacterium]